MNITLAAFDELPKEIRQGYIDTAKMVLPEKTYGRSFSYHRDMMEIARRLIRKDIERVNVILKVMKDVNEKGFSNE